MAGPRGCAEERCWYRDRVPQGPELIIILVVILVLFGGSKLPGLARSLGQAQGEFKKGLKTPDEDPASPPPADQPPS